MQKSTLFKILALASLAGFAYYHTKESGKQLSGDPEGVVDKIMPWLNINPEIKPIVKLGMVKAANSVFKSKGIKYVGNNY
jgi:hypothetical protein